MLTTKQKADWADSYTSEQWERVMDLKQFPAVMGALAEGDLVAAERIMRRALNAPASCREPELMAR
jgi:hypothetical protein